MFGDLQNQGIVPTDLEGLVRVLIASSLVVVVMVMVMVVMVMVVVVMVATEVGVSSCMDCRQRTRGSESKRKFTAPCV